MHTYEPRKLWHAEYVVHKWSNYSTCQTNVWCLRYYSMYIASLFAAKIKWSVLSFCQHENCHISTFGYQTELKNYQTVKNSEKSSAYSLPGNGWCGTQALQNGQYLLISPLCLSISLVTRPSPTHTPIIHLQFILIQQKVEIIKSIVYVLFMTGLGTSLHID